jgi:hypothetical protein
VVTTRGGRIGFRTDLSLSYVSCYF